MTEQKEGAIVFETRKSERPPICTRCSSDDLLVEVVRASDITNELLVYFECRGCGHQDQKPFDVVGILERFWLAFEGVKP